MNAKHAVHLQSRSARRRQDALGVIRPKHNFRIMQAFENVLVHLAIARAVPRVPARSRENDFPARLPARRVELNGPAFQGKAAANGVQHVREIEVGSGLRGIQLQHQGRRGWRCLRGQRSR